MIQPRQIKIFNVISLKFRHGLIFSPVFAIKNNRRRVPRSELIRLRNWINNYLEYTGDSNE